MELLKRYLEAPDMSSKSLHQTKEELLQRRS